MGYTYLLDLYQLVDTKKQTTTQRIPQGQSTPRYDQGRLDLLTEFNTFLGDQLNDKLPRRLRKRFQSPPNTPHAR